MDDDDDEEYDEQALQNLKRSRSDNKNKSNHYDQQLS